MNRRAEGAGRQKKDLRVVQGREDEARQEHMAVGVGRIARFTETSQLEPSGLEAGWVRGVMQSWSLGRLRIS